MIMYAINAILLSWSQKNENQPFKESWTVLVKLLIVSKQLQPFIYRGIKNIIYLNS